MFVTSWKSMEDGSAQANVTGEEPGALRIWYLTESRDDAKEYFLCLFRWPLSCREDFRIATRHIGAMEDTAKNDYAKIDYTPKLTVAEAMLLKPFLGIGDDWALCAPQINIADDPDGKLAESIARIGLSILDLYEKVGSDEAEIEAMTVKVIETAAKSHELFQRKRSLVELLSEALGIVQDRFMLNEQCWKTTIRHVAISNVLMEKLKHS